MGLKLVHETDFYEVYSIFEGWTLLNHCAPLARDHIVEILDNFKVRSEYLQFGGKKGLQGFGSKTIMSIDLQYSFLNKNFSEKPFLIAITVNGEPHSNKYTHRLDNFFETDQIAIEIEWNNKDTFYHRDLNNLALLHQFECIRCGVIVTKNSDWSKYGTSTTHFNKLEEFIHAGASRTCPLVIFAIKPSVIIETGINLHVEHEYREELIRNFKEKEKAIDAAKPLKKRKKILRNL